MLGMSFFARRGWTLGDAVTSRLDKRLLRRAQRSLEPVLRDGEVVVAFDPATVSDATEVAIEAGGSLVTLYLTDMALYVLTDAGAAVRIDRSDIVGTLGTSPDRIDLELAGGGRLIAHPAPAPSRIARELAPPD